MMMRILQAEIYGFGKFTDTKFDFEHKLQFITGANEAGKSTLKAFISAILFGFVDRRQRFKRYEPKNGARYGGKLIIEQEKQLYTLERLEGEKGGQLVITSLNTGQQLPASLLQRWLNSLTSDLFEAVYAVDQTSLEQIRQLAPEELEKSFLTIAASGSQQIMMLQKKLQKKAEQIYKPNGRLPQLNRLLQTYEKQTQELRAANRDSHLFVEWEKTLEKEKEQQEAVKNQIKILEKELLRQRQLDNLWPTFVELERLRTKEKNQQPIGLTPQEFTALQELQLKVKTKQDSSNSLTAKSQALMRQGQQTINLEELQKYDAAKDQFDNLFHQLDVHSTEIQLALELQQTVNQQLSSPQAASRENEVLRRTRKKVQKPLFKQNRRQLALLGWALIAGSCLLLSFFSSKITIKLLAVGGLLAALFAVWQSMSKKSGQSESRSQNSLSTGSAQERDLMVQSVEAKRLQQLLEQLAFFTQASAFCTASLQLPVELLKRLARLQQFKTRIKDALRERSKRDRFLDYYRQEHERVTAELNALTEQLKQQLQKNGASSFAHLQAQYLQQQQNTEKNAKLQGLQTQLPAEVQNELRRYQSREEFKAHLSKKQDELQHQKERLSQLTVSITEKEVRLEQFGKSVRILRLKQELANKQAQILAEVDSWLALNAANQCLEKVLEIMSQHTLPHVMQLAQHYFRRLTRDQYEKIVMVERHLQLVDKNKTQYDVRELSRATAEQLYLALRLAFIVQINRTIKLPVLIDDCFVNFDEQRRNELLALLEEISAETQIICFTVDISFLYDKVDKENILRVD